MSGEQKEKGKTSAAATEQTMSDVEQQQVRRDRNHTFGYSNLGSAARLEVRKRGEGKGKAAVRKRDGAEGEGPGVDFYTRC
jgi:hypothetical protein